MSKRDYYEVLGVSKDASDAEIKKSFLKSWPSSIIRTATLMIRRRLKKKFKEINEAYSVLSNSQKTRPVRPVRSGAFQNGNAAVPVLVLVRAASEDLAALAVSARAVRASVALKISLIPSLAVKAAGSRPMGLSGAPICAMT